MTRIDESADRARQMTTVARVVWDRPPYVQVGGLRVVNPPLLVRDPHGDVVRDGPAPGGGVRQPRRYRLEPAAALAEVVAVHGGDGGRAR